MRQLVVSASPTTRDRPGCVQIRHGPARRTCRRWLRSLRLPRLQPRLCVHTLDMNIVVEWCSLLVFSIVVVVVPLHYSGASTLSTVSHWRQQTCQFIFPINSDPNPVRYPAGIRSGQGRQQSGQTEDSQEDEPVRQQSEDSQGS